MGCWAAVKYPVMNKALLIVLKQTLCSAQATLQLGTCRISLGRMLEGFKRNRKWRDCVNV